MIDLDELERLEKAATPGPWKDVWNREGIDIIRVCALYEDDDPEKYAAFIVAARNNLPGLIAELRQARAELAALREAVKPMLGANFAFCEVGFMATALDVRDALKEIIKDE